MLVKVQEHLEGATVLVGDHIHPAPNSSEPVL